MTTPHNRLIITPVSEDSCIIPIGPPFICEINPSSLSLDFKIIYYPESYAAGTVNDQLRFDKGASPELSFEIIIDGTGAAGQTTGTPIDVDAKVEAFKKACYYYVGEKHCPPHVLITWWAPLLRYRGQVFSGAIDSFNLTYTLFSPSGLPLRAKIRTKFIGSMDVKTDASVTAKKSPDLTHIKTINEGTSLSALCKEIYGDESFILEVARLNNLVSFRNIKPGSKLIFPPIK